MEHFAYVATDGQIGIAKLTGFPEEYGLETETPAVKTRGYIGEDCIPIYEVTDVDRVVATLSPSNLSESDLRAFDIGGEFLTMEYSEQTNQITGITNELNIDWTNIDDLVAPRDGFFHGFSYEEITAAMNQALENQAQDETPAPHCEMLLGQNDTNPTIGMKNG